MIYFDRTNLKEHAPKLLLSALLFWLPAIAFFRIADEVREREAIRVDTSLLEWLHGFATPGINRLAVFVTTLGDGWLIGIIAACIGAYLLYKRNWRQTIFFLGSVCGAGAANIALKLLFHRARPSLWSPILPENDYSFPSGHAMLTVAFALSLVYLLWETCWRWLAVAVAVLYVAAVGVSRLYLGVHFPTDVLAGWCASLIWVGIMAYLAGKRRHFPTSSPDSKQSPS